MMMGHQCILLQRMKRRPKRMDSTNDRLMQSIFQQPSALSDVENELLAAAEDGDLATVQLAIQEYNVSPNCVDHLGRSALELALMGDHNEIVEYLVPRTNLQCLEDALLYAIGGDNVKMTELILDHPLYKNQRLQMANAGGFYQQDMENPRLRPYTTPIILAAQRNNFHIVQLLLNRGATISTPHDYFCDCIECSNMRVFDSVKYSRSRLTTYRAMASAAYISLQSGDPILKAFQLSHQLEQLADVEKEYKSDYRRLANQCKDHAVELLGLCRSSEEIMALLNEDGCDTPSDTNSLARVKLALKYEQKRFIAHATCQRQLISLWYSGLPWMRHQKSVVKLLSVPLAIILLPVCSMAFLIAPNSTFGKKLRSPFVKFLNHTCAYIVFLTLVLMATLRGGSGNIWLDMGCMGVERTSPYSVVSVLILVWVLGMFVHECRQLWREGPKNYITDWWNWMDSSLILLYLAHYALQIVVFAKVMMADTPVRQLLCPNVSIDMSCREMGCIVDNIERNWSVCNAGGDCSTIDHLYGPHSKGEILDTMSDMNQLSDIFFALASVLSFARIAHLLPANEELGPLLVSFGRMLHDVMRFGVVFALVFCSFMCGLTTLYRSHKCENKHFSSLDLSLSSLFWATFGMGDTRATLIDNRYLGSGRGLISSHTKHNPLVVLVGYGLFWSYIAGAVVVLLNMLIAMMSNSFQEIYDDRDVEWKFAKAKLWIDFFEDGCTLPTPFNLIPNPKYLYRMFRSVKRQISKTREDPPVQLAYIYARRKNGMTGEDLTNVQMPTKPDSLYCTITKRLVQRFIYKVHCENVEDNQAKNDVSDLKLDVSALVTDISKLRHEMAFIQSTVGNGVRQKNGMSLRQRSLVGRENPVKRTASSIHSRIELQV